MRMTDDRIPKQLFLSEIWTGTRAQGAPLKRYKDAVKSSLKACSIPVMGWEALTLDHASWRQAVSQGCRMFESKRGGDLARKRQDRKERQSTASRHVACPTCGQLCASEFGLRRHQLNCIVDNDSDPRRKRASTVFCSFFQQSSHHGTSISEGNMWWYEGNTYIINLTKINTCTYFKLVFEPCIRL